MDCYLIRHTTPEVPEGVCYGQTDVPPADSFDEEIGLLKAKLPELDGPAVYSSPLVRCMKLAETLYPGRVRLEEDLMELNFGRWEMKRWDEIPQDESAEWMEDWLHRAAPGGESYMEVSRRVVTAFEAIVDEDASPTVIVGHGGSLRIIVAHVLGLPFERAFALGLDYGSLSKLTLDGPLRTVDYLNR